MKAIQNELQELLALSTQARNGNKRAAQGMREVCGVTALADFRGFTLGISAALAVVGRHIASATKEETMT